MECYHTVYTEGTGEIVEKIPFYSRGISGFK